MLLLEEKKKNLNVQRHSECSFNLRKLDLLSATGTRNLRIAQEEKGDLMVFPSVGKDRAWLRCASSSRGSWWPEGQRISFPAFIDSSGITFSLPEQKSFTSALVRAAYELGWFPFLPLCASSRCPCGRVCLEAALPPTIQRALVQVKGKNFISSFLSFCTFLFFSRFLPWISKLWAAELGRTQ